MLIEKDCIRINYTNPDALNAIFLKLTGCKTPVPAS
jgi:hypothetical protein